MNAALMMLFWKLGPYSEIPPLQTNVDWSTVAKAPFRPTVVESAARTTVATAPFRTTVVEANERD